MSHNQYKIGVMGKAGRSKGIPEPLAKKAKAIGGEIAKNNCTLITGGCMGVSFMATKGASEQDRLTLWYSPAKNLKEHLEPPISYPYPPENTKVIFTETSKPARNVLSIIESQGVMFVGGGIGTLNELTVAYHEGKVLGILDVEGTPKEFKKKVEEIKKGGAVIVEDKDPNRLVSKVIKELDQRDFTPRKEIPITFKNKQGLQLAGIFHLPDKQPLLEKENEPKHPLVIISHGFDGTKEDKKAVETARALREEGIAVLRFDFEGCGDSEGKFKEMTITKEVDDLNSAFKAIRKQADLSPDKIGLIGSSLGTVVSALFVQKFEVPVKAMVFWSQGFNQRDLFKLWHEPKDLEQVKEKGFVIQGSKKIGLDYIEENREKDYSSVLSEISVPILLIQGEQDEDVPPKFSKQLAESYNNVWLELLPAEHQLENPLVREQLVDLAVDWFKKHF